MNNNNRYPNLLFHDATIAIAITISV
jgi:hypothetical protein